MVDIATYRARIGCFSFRLGFAMDLDTLRVIGVFGFIGILLLIAGVEMNPGPFDRFSDYVSNVKLVYYTIPNCSYSFTFYICGSDININTTLL